jgi:hypothetical protein
MKSGEKGQALVIVLFLVAFGTLVISPFLGHAGSGLIGARTFGELLNQEYSSDAGVEHAIWGLAFGDLADQLPDIGDNVSYQLGETINGIIPDITVLRSDNITYHITSTASDQTIQAVVDVAGENVTVRQWQINP